MLQGTCDKDKKGCFGELRTALVITFIVQVFTNNFMQSIVGWLKYRANYKKESMGASGTGAFSASFSIPELQYLLAEFDETLDNIVAYQAQATQYRSRADLTRTGTATPRPRRGDSVETDAGLRYGYITLFSSAFPAASVLALLNNMLLMRFDVIKFLSFYRRIQPDGAEDIGMYQHSSARDLSADGSRRRRGDDVDIPRRRVAATPPPRRGQFAATNRGDTDSPHRRAMATPRLRRA